MTRCSALCISFALALTALHAQSPSPVKAKPAARTGAAPRRQPPASPAKTGSEVLTNATVVRMVAAGLDEQTIVARIQTAPAAEFALGTDDLIALKEAKVSGPVIRAMLNRTAAKPAAAEPSAVAVKDPGPGLPQPASTPEPVPALPPNLDRVTVRQGTTLTPLVDKAQSVTFVKSEAGSVGSAIANIVLSDVGLQLITMGMSSQMMMWNPYLGDTLAKAANLGKGMLLNRGSDTKGFEIETLPGMTAEATLKEGTAEIFVPIRQFLPSADLDPSTIEPVLLQLAARPQEGTRLLSGRKVLLKQTKKGRFDLKPTTERIESDLEQTLIPITVDRLPDGVLRIAPRQDLKRGEYALVFRRKDAAGGSAANVPLKPSAQATAGAQTAETEAAAASIPGMSQEMWAQMTPEQKQMIRQQMAQTQEAQQSQPRGLFGRPRRPAPAPQTAPASGDVAGFIAWEFRVMP